jgi:SAM-dependent methyltransferase
MLFLPVLTARVKDTANEIDGLLNIFDQYNVPKDGLILDMACGIGRHSIALAKHGYRVVGIDISSEYIEVANVLAKENGIENYCTFIVGDIRDLGEILKDYENRFNTIINMFTSLGYYEKETDIFILEQARRLSSNGGILVIEIMNRDLVTQRLKKTWHEIPGELIYLEDPAFSPVDSRLKSTWMIYKPEGDDLRFLGNTTFDNRLYSLHELREIVEKGGWCYRKSYGGIRLTPFSFDSNKIVLIATAT